MKQLRSAAINAKFGRKVPLPKPLRTPSTTRMQPNSQQNGGQQQMLIVVLSGLVHDSKHPNGNFHAKAPAPEDKEVVQSQMANNLDAVTPESKRDEFQQHARHINLYCGRGSPEFRAEEDMHTNFYRSLGLAVLIAIECTALVFVSAAL